MDGGDGHKGQVVFLNGVSSSGKSSIARQLQLIVDPPHFHMSVDAFNSMRARQKTLELGASELTAVLARTRAGFHRAIAGMAEAGNDVIVEIDNIVFARPQTGLTRADIVYLLPAEGGLSRILAVFSSRFPPVIGPVRSAREVRPNRPGPRSRSLTARPCRSHPVRSGWYSRSGLVPPGIFDGEGQRGIVAVAGRALTTATRDQLFTS